MYRKIKNKSSMLAVISVVTFSCFGVVKSYGDERDSFPTNCTINHQNDLSCKFGEAPHEQEVAVSVTQFAINPNHDRGLSQMCVVSLQAKDQIWCNDEVLKERNNVVGWYLAGGTDGRLTYNDRQGFCVHNSNRQVWCNSGEHINANGWVLK